MAEAENEEADTDTDLLAEAKTLFELAVEREAKNRENALHDLRFVRLREQWHPSDVRQRELDGRPCLVIDKLGPFARQVVNDARQNRPAIKVHPVGAGANTETAEIFNGIIRNIEVISDADTAYDTALDFSVNSGIGYLKANTRYCDDESFLQEVVIERVADPSRIYGDPYSEGADSSDWNDAFETEALTTAEFEKRFPKAEPVDWDSPGYSGLGEHWRDGDRVVVASWWRREQTPRTIFALSNGEVVDEDVLAENEKAFEEQGITVVGERVVPSHKVTQRVMTGAKILETLDWPGRYIPIIPVYGDDIIIEGERHLASLVRPAIDAQKMYNVARSAETEALGMALKSPVIGAVGAFATDADKWETANVENHAFLQYDPVAGANPPERQPPASPPTGWMSAAAAAADDIKAAVGMFDASQGQGAANQQSGKAILGLQGRSDTSTFHFVDNQNRGIRHLGRVVIDLIPHIYSTERVERIITADGEHQSVPINQPVPVMGPDGQPQKQLGTDGQPLIDPITGEPMIVTKIYDLAAGKYDLTVQAGPGFATRRQESAAQMIDVMQAYPESAPVIAPRLAKMLDWPGAEEIGDELAQVAAAKAQQGNPQADQAQEAAKIQADAAIQQQRAAADAEAAKAKAASDLEVARVKMLGELQLAREKAAQEAQIAREKVEADYAVQVRKAELEAQLQRQRFVMEAAQRQPLDQVVPGGAVG